MLRTMQIASMIVLGAVVAEVSLWVTLQGVTWWIAPVSALVIYASILSLFVFRDRDVWITKGIGVVWRLALSTMPRATACFCVLLAAGIAGSLFVHRSWPTPIEVDNHLRVQVFEGNPVRGKFRVGAKLELTLFPSEDTYAQNVADNGIAEFELPGPGSMTLTITDMREGHLQIAGWPGFDVLRLPKIVPVDISILADNDWQVVGQQETERHLQLVAVSATDLAPRPPEVEIGPTLHEQENAPWGVPQAPVIIRRSAYILGYDPTIRIPRWVAYVIRKPLTDQRHKRESRPRVDSDIPIDRQAAYSDYRRSGYDRGNLISHLDMQFRGEAEYREAMLLSTVAPQTPELNRRVWVGIERYARNLLDTAEQVYIIAGPAFLKKAADGRLKYFVLGKNRVAVPTHFFRVVIRQRVDGTLQVTSFLVPNAVDIDADINAYLKSIDHIEKVTGLDLLVGLEDGVEAELEASIASSVEL